MMRIYISRFLILSFLLLIYLITGAQESWVVRANTPAATAKGFSFVINGKAYLGGGMSGNVFWEYDPVSNTWVSKAICPITGVSDAVAFSIGNKGYAGTGAGGGNQLWEYDPATNTWTQKASLPGVVRWEAVAFSVAGKGYIGTGLSGSGYRRDFYQYDPATNTWTGIPDLPGNVRGAAIGIATATKGYVGLGWTGFYLNDFWEYDPVANNWTARNNYVGSPRSGPAGFVLNDRLYIGSGYAGGLVFSDLWEFNPATNGWASRLGNTVNDRLNGVGFAIAGKGYLATGNTNSGFTNSCWMYTRGCITPITNNTISITGPSAFCGTSGVGNPIITGSTPSGGTGSSFTYAWFTSTDGVNFLSEPLQIGKDYVSNGFSQTTYLRRVVASQADVSCINESNTLVVTINPLPAQPVLSPPVDTLHVCDPSGHWLTSSAPSGNQWYKNNVPISGATATSYQASGNGDYHVVVTNAQNCSRSSASDITVVMETAPPAAVLTAEREVICNGSFTMLQSSAATGNTWFRNNVVIPAATGNSYMATQAGSYKVSAGNGYCSSESNVLMITADNTVNPIITAGGPLMLCGSGSVTLTSGIAAGNQWYKNGVVIPGATNASYNATTAGVYHTQVMNANGCCLPSNALTFSPDAGNTAPLLWGATTNGGPAGAGGIYTLDLNNCNLKSREHISFNADGRFPVWNAMAEGSGGKLYGAMTQSSGSSYGNLFRYDTATHAYTILHTFTYAHGYYPQSAVLFYGNKLYGTASYGGTSDRGTLFSYDTVTKLYTVLRNFSNTDGGQLSNAGIIAMNGKIYGTASQFGTYSGGVLYSYDTLSQTYTVLHHFGDVNDGSYPNGRLILAPDGKIYGVTNSGNSAAYQGTLFSFNPSGNVYTQVLIFPGLWWGPTGLGLGSDGALYGFCNQGGSNSKGAAFRYDIVLQQLTKVADLATATTGDTPEGSLVAASNGLLYGGMFQGGANSGGTLVAINPATQTLTKVADMTTATGTAVSATPMEASNGLLYGFTQQGGASSRGVLYSFNPSNNEYLPALHLGKLLGQFPQSGLVLANNGKLYGTTIHSSASNGGALYSIDPVNNSAQQVVEMIPGDIRGWQPMGPLFAAANGKLYGMMSSGGTAGNGVVYMVQPATNTYTKLIDLNGSTGFAPTGGFIENGGMLYALTQAGGSNGGGTLIRIDTATSSLVVLYHFSTQGRVPYGSLLLASNGKLYGMTNEGGGSNKGVVFSFNLATNTYTRHVDFTIINGASPRGTLLEGAGGKLYGTTLFGGIGNPGMGTIFSFDTTNNTLASLYSFNANGYYPSGRMLLASDGKMYGTTKFGGSFNGGVVFRFDPNGAVYTKLRDLESTTGTNPPEYDNGLIELPAAASANLSTVAVSTKGGNWSDPAVWSNGKVPDATTRVTIVHDVIVDINLATCYSLQVQCRTVHVPPGNVLQVLH